MNDTYRSDKGLIRMKHNNLSIYLMRQYSSVDTLERIDKTNLNQGISCFAISDAIISCVQDSDLNFL